MKQNYFLIQVIFLLILILPLVSASGCFIYKDSSMYCQDLEQISAEQECTNYENCALQAVFIEGKSCVSVNDCKKVMCKSSCQLEFSGKCTTGEIEAGKEQEWCTDGCCKFNYGTNYCDYKDTKWLCEIEAWNKGVNGFVFDNLMKKEECKSYCAVELSSNENITKGLKLEEIYSEQWNNTTLIKEQTNSKSSGGFIWVIILVLLGIGVVYFFYTNKNSIKSEILGTEVGRINYQKENDEFTKRMEKDLQAAVIKERLDEAKEKHAFKTKGKERDEFFAEFGLLSKSKTRSTMEKLKSLGRFYEMKKKNLHTILPVEEKKALDKLGELVTRLKKVEARVINQEKTGQEAIIKKVESIEKEVIKKEAEEAILALRKIARKK